MGTLNRSKPFGIVCGIAPWAFEQAGKYFNYEGNEVDKDGKLVLPPPKLPTPPPQDPPAEGATDGVGDSTVTTETTDSTEPAPTTDGEEDAVDLPSREEIMAKLDDANIPYNPRSRKSKLLELLKGQE